jgi:hypothetical protein
MLFETAPGTLIPERVPVVSSGPSFSNARWKTTRGGSSELGTSYRPAGSQHSVRTPSGAKYLGLFHGSARMVANGGQFPQHEE